MKKIFLGIVFLFCLTGCGSDNDNITIVTSNFPGYDFARAITKDSDVNVKMLIKPGSEMHDYEPTPKDIIDIKNSDLFIYVGGDSDSWIDDIVSDIDVSHTKVVKLMDMVDLKKEELKEGMEGEEEDEYDEHVWTSPKNSIQIVEKLKDSIIKIDSSNKDLYESNAGIYIEKLNDIDLKIKEVVSNSKKK